MRQASPSFHQNIAYGLEAPNIRFSAFECFRGSAKTTLSRILGLAKRAAYGLSNTTMMIGSSQADAVRSLRWMKRNIVANPLFTEFYGLRKGEKWRDDEIHIINDKLEMSIWMIALGMTGSIRGMNFDDYRPDFIMIDDPCDEENTGTKEQRKKTEELLTGSVMPGLAPVSECPHAKIAMLQTGLHEEDLVHKAHRDKLWYTEKIPCFTYNAAGEPDGSRWPERWTLEDLLELKESYISRGMIHTWLREYECKIVSSETALFNIGALKYYNDLPPKNEMRVYCGIDPASSEAKDAHHSAIVFIGVHGPAAYLLDYYVARGKNPEELWNEYFSRAMIWRPIQTGVESIAYQKMLAWYFRQKMNQMQVHFAIKPVQDRRKKSDRITQAHAGRISNGMFFVNRGQTEYIEALSKYTGEEDFDILDAGAQALDLVAQVGQVDSWIEGEYARIDEKAPPLRMTGGAP